MVGVKKKKKQSESMPQYKVGGIYHSDLYRDGGRNGHFVVVAEILSSTQIKVHICTSSETLASKGSVSCFGLLGPSETYILKKADIISPSQIGQSRHMSISPDVARELGIRL